MPPPSLPTPPPSPPTPHHCSRRYLLFKTVCMHLQYLFRYIISIALAKAELNAVLGEPTTVQAAGKKHK
jgi:hypothetical protein